MKLSAISSAGSGIRVNPDWAKLPLFDRSKWQRVRFGDVVKNVNETEPDPAEAGIERFIGLEHLEPGSLHVRSWGMLAEQRHARPFCCRVLRAGYNLGSALP